jgi:outer membrane protein assembly factor BamB
LAKTNNKRLIGRIAFMKKIVAAAVMGAALFAGVAFADTLTNAFSNTLTTTGADGVTYRWAFNADNTYTVYTPDGASLAGTWTRTGETLCVTPAGGAQQCAPIVDGKVVGDSWTVQTENGAVTVSLVAGRP